MLVLVKVYSVCIDVNVYMNSMKGKWNKNIYIILKIFLRDSFCCVFVWKKWY